MSTPDALKVLHDRLLTEQPEGATHDSGNCPLCASEDTDTNDPGGLMPETFTQGDIDAATTAATEPLQKRLAELEAQVQESEVGRAVADATKAKDTEISALQEQLDAATAARTAAENKLSENEKFWTDAIAAQQAAEQLAARKEQRIAEATDAGVFDEKYIAEHAERFAAMSDEDFKARLDEWRLIAGKTTTTPVRTALTASDATSGSKPPLSLIGELRSKRVDPRTLTGGI